MKGIEPWVNSNYHQDKTLIMETHELSSEQKQRLLRYQMELQQDADNLLSVVIILTCLLLSVAGVLYVMWENHLIVH